MMEIKLQKQVLDYLTKHKIWKLRYTASTTYGIPDILCIYNGYAVGIELKRPDKKGKATLLQKETIRSIQEAGGMARIVDNIEDVEDIFYALEVTSNVDHYDSEEVETALKILDKWQHTD